MTHEKTFLKLEKINKLEGPMEVGGYDNLNTGFVPTLPLCIVVLIVKISHRCDSHGSGIRESVFIFKNNDSAINGTSISLPTKLQEYCGRGDRKNLRVRVTRRSAVECYLPNMT